MDDSGTANMSRDSNTYQESDHPPPPNIRPDPPSDRDESGEEDDDDDGYPPPPSPSASALSFDPKDGERKRRTFFDVFRKTARNTEKLRGLRSFQRRVASEGSISVSLLVRNVYKRREDEKVNNTNRSDRGEHEEYSDYDPEDEYDGMYDPTLYPDGSTRRVNCSFMQEHAKWMKPLFAETLDSFMEMLAAIKKGGRARNLLIWDDIIKRVEHRTQAVKWIASKIVFNRITGPSAPWVRKENTAIVANKILAAEEYFSRL